MKHAYTLIPFLVVVISCATQPKQTGPEAILVQMRADTSWIHHLDSLAQTAIGPGAKCLDPVSHSFTYDGRTWIFNQDWGGVLEIPADYIIEDDLWQAKISFHGTHAWSPDSTILVSFYAGFQCLDKEEFTESILESLEEDGFFVRVACLGLADEVHDHPAMIAWHRKCSPSWTGISFYRSRPHHPASGSGKKPIFLHRGFAPPLVCPREHRPVFPYLGMLDGEALPRVGKA